MAMLQRNETNHNGDDTPLFSIQLPVSQASLQPCGIKLSKK